MTLKHLLLQSFFWGSLCMFSSCGGNLDKLEDIEVEDQAGVERAEDVIVYYSDSAIVRARIKAPVMLSYIDPKNPRREFPEGIDGDFYDVNAKPTSKVRARYAVQSDRDKNMLLKDSVQIWNKKQERLEAEELTWNEGQKSIYTSGRVKIFTPTRVIKGYHFRSDMEFTNWEIDSVTGEFAVNSLSEGGL